MTQGVRRVLPVSHQGEGSHGHCHVVSLQDTEGESVKRLAGFPLWFLRTHSPSLESWAVTGDQMTPLVAIYHNREKWALSSRNKLYQFWESWPLLQLDKDGGVTPLLTVFYSRGPEPCSGWIEVLALPLGLQMHWACLWDRRLTYLEYLCVEMIYRISDGLPMTTAESNGEVFLLQCRSLHSAWLAST